MEGIGAIFPILMVLFFLGIGFFVGGWTERSHFQRIKKQKKTLSHILITQIKTFPFMVRSEKPPQLVMGEAVIATDYLKNVLATLRNIFGGEIKSYQTLLERAREEAMIRMIRTANSAGYNAVCNVRLETADIGGNTTQKRVATVAVIASGTAYNCSQEATPKASRSGHSSGHSSEQTSQQREG